MALSPPDATNHNTQIPPMQMQMQMQMQQSKAGGGGGGGGKGLSGKQINHVVLSAMEELWHKLELTGYCDHRRGLAVPGGLGSGGGGGGGNDDSDDEDDDDDGRAPLPPLLPTHFALPAEHQCGQLRRGGAAGNLAAA